MLNIGPSRADDLATVDVADSLDLLRSNGFGGLVDAMADHSLYEGSGRLVRSRLARRLGMTDDATRRLLSDARDSMSDDDA